MATFVDGFLDVTLANDINRFINPIYDNTIMNNSNIPNVQSETWLSKMLGRSDPLLDVDWDVLLPNGFPSEYIEQIHAPLPDFDISNAFLRGGRKFFVAEHTDIKGLRLTFYEDNTMKSLLYLWNWRNSIQNGDGTFNYPNTYKKTIVVYPMDTMGNKLLQLNYYGCFPHTLPSISFLSERTTPVNYTVDFKVDYLDIQYI